MRPSSLPVPDAHAAKNQRGMNVRACIDTPQAEQLCDPFSFRIEGWIDVTAVNEKLESVEVWLDRQKLAHTNLLFPRPDVSRALGFTVDTPTGFRLLGHCEQLPPARARLDLRLRLGDRTLVTVASVDVQFSQKDYRRANFGNLLEHTTTDCWRRKDMNTSGPSLVDGSPEVATLLQQYLPPPPCGVLDVGCGLGHYGKLLRQAGYDWQGVETKASDCAELMRQQLPVRQVDGVSLPFAAGAFDAAMCIEVLEHIEEPRPFLAEIRRVSPGRLLVSVPNSELLPYLVEWSAMPLHMIESDHKNFFTRWSLAALLREFYSDVDILLHTQHPLATKEGLPLFNHLFAVARTKK